MYVYALDLARAWVASSHYRISLASQSVTRLPIGHGGKVIASSKLRPGSISSIQKGHTTVLHLDRARVAIQLDLKTLCAHMGIQ